MSDNIPPPVATRPGPSARYGGTQAASDIREVLTGTSRLAPEQAAPVAGIITRDATEAAVLAVTTDGQTAVPSPTPEPARAAPGGDLP